MDTFSAILTLCVGNSHVTGEFSTQRPVTRSFDAFFDLRLNKCWVNNHEAGDLRRHRAHYGVIVMQIWVTFLCHQATVIYHFIFSLCSEGPFIHSQSVPIRACTPGGGGGGGGVWVCVCVCVCVCVWGGGGGGGGGGARLLQSWGLTGVIHAMYTQSLIDASPSIPHNAHHLVMHQQSHQINATGSLFY